MNCKSVERSATVECEKKESEIMNTWFPEIIQLLTNEEILGELKEEQLDSFYNCASTLMSNQVFQIYLLHLVLRIRLYDVIRKYIMQDTATTCN